MIQIQAVSKSYDGQKKAVDNLSLDIMPGEIFGLLGPNGAGKSTLLNMMTGILEADSGHILVDGANVREEPLKAKRQIAFVSDSPDHLLRFTGYEFLRFIADIYEIPEEKRLSRVQQLAEDFSMTDDLGAQIQSYSHGMRQKIMVMGALIANPSNWILDEPMTGLDPRAAFLLKQKMREHADAGNTVLFSTHVLDVAEKVVDRVGVIDHGRLLFVGTVPELRSHFAENATLEDMFLELTSDDSPLGEAVSATGAGAEDELSSSDRS